MSRLMSTFWPEISSTSLSALAVKALARLSVYAGSSETWLLSIDSLTLKAPPIICSRRLFQFCRLFKNNK